MRIINKSTPKRLNLRCPWQLVGDMVTSQTKLGQERQVCKMVVEVVKPKETKFRLHFATISDSNSVTFTAFNSIEWEARLVIIIITLDHSVGLRTDLPIV